MYKWPQGKVLRMLLLIMALVAAGDLAWQCYGTVEAIQAAAGVAGVAGEDGGARWQLFVIAGLLGTLSLVFLIGGVACVGFVPYTVDRLIEVQQEMVKVTWPKQSEVLRSTVIITVMTVILASLIFLVDTVNIAVVVNRVLQRGG